MDAAAGTGMLTVCLGVAGFLLRLARHADNTERRRTQRPGTPRHPGPRSGSEMRDLLAREPGQCED